MALALNLITDIAGIRVGNVHDAAIATGVTVVLFDGPNTASGIISGGAPGSRDTVLLAPEMTVQGIDAVVLSGGSAFGLDAAGGVLSVLRDAGVGLRIGNANVPLAVQAITFDLLNGGNKAWGRMPPYWEMGFEAARNAATGAFPLGSIGGGYGTSTAVLKGGLGSASAVTPSGFAVGAIVVVNAVGAATIGNGPHFWAAPYERADEFGGLGMPARFGQDELAMRIKGGLPPSTTIGLVVTNAALAKPQVHRLAVMADDGLARAIRPAHAPMDGDTVFAVATGTLPVSEPDRQLTEIGLCAADCLARAIARGVYEATALPFPGAIPAWRDRFGSV